MENNLGSRTKIIHQIAKKRCPRELMSRNKKLWDNRVTPIASCYTPSIYFTRCYLRSYKSRCFINYILQ